MGYDNTCHTCNGDGSLQCNKCFGTGSITCFKCDGTGHVQNLGPLSMSGPGIPGGSRLWKGGPRMPANLPLGNSKPCWKCDATGRLPCRKCGERGYIECLRCNGTGRYDKPSNFSVSSVSRSDNTRPAEPRTSGSVKWFNPTKGFGFIVSDSGEDVFVSQKNLDGVVELQAGDRVEFVCKTGNKGLWAAVVRKV